MILRGEQVTLRPLREDDVPGLRSILAEPAVAPWWGTPDDAGLWDGTPFAVEEDGELIGWVAYHEEEEPDYRHAGIDLFLTGARHGFGLGADTLRTLARHLLEERGHHRLTIDPAAANARAIRAYERVGFRPVGVMRRCERGPDGAWRDGLLMDLLAGELR